VLGIQETLKNKALGGYRWSWASGKAWAVGWDWMLPAPLPPPSVSTPLCVEASLILTKAKFLLQGVKLGPPAAPKFYVWLLLSSRKIDLQMFFESDFKNPRQGFLFGSVLERCQPLNQPAEAWRLSQLGPMQCPWKLYWDRGRSSFKKNRILKKTKTLGVYFICPRGYGRTSLIRHLLRSFLE